MSEPGASEALSVDHALERTSEKGLIDARLELVDSALKIGENDLLLGLAAGTAAGQPALDSVVATMPSHGHSAAPRSIRTTSDGYFIDALPLSMAGFWRIECDLRVDGTTDSVVFDVDVP